MNGTRRSKRFDEGFTIVELTFVVLLIGILLLVAVASFKSSSSRAVEAACLSNQRTIITAITMYRADNPDDGDPGDWTDLALYVQNIEKIRRCPLDPDVEFDLETVTCPNHPY